VSAVRRPRVDEGRARSIRPSTLLLRHVRPTPNAPLGHGFRRLPLPRRHHRPRRALASAFPLALWGYADMVELLAERGVHVDPSRVVDWVQRCTPLIKKRHARIATVLVPPGVGFQVSCAVVHYRCAHCPTTPAPIRRRVLLVSLARPSHACFPPPQDHRYSPPIPPIRTDRRKVRGTFESAYLTLVAERLCRRSRTRPDPAHDSVGRTGLYRREASALGVVQRYGDAAYQRQVRTLGLSAGLAQGFWDNPRLLRGTASPFTPVGGARHLESYNGGRMGLYGQDMLA